VQGAFEHPNAAFARPQAPFEGVNAAFAR
jgi:hypothetical protein